MPAEVDFENLNFNTSQPGGDNAREKFFADVWAGIVVPVRFISLFLTKGCEISDFVTLVTYGCDRVP